MEKKCNRCKESLSVGKFNKSSSTKDGYQHTCKKCQNAYSRDRRKNDPVWAAKQREANKEWRIKNPERTKDLCYRNRFGISLDKYEDLKKEQNNTCSICGLPEIDKVLVVDHCHKTGKVRGLLCNNCNTAIGMFNDDIDIMSSAISYLINSKIKKTG